MGRKGDTVLTYMMCPHCRGIIGDTDAFCAGCGNALRGTEASSPVQQGIQTQAIPVPMPPQIPTPVAPAPTTQLVEQSQELSPASAWKRFFNAVLDMVFFQSLAFLAGFAWGIVGIGAPTPAYISVVLSIAMYLVYFIFFETIFQRTPAKFITGTKVVLMSGAKAGFGSIIIRTLCREIPLDALSFLKRTPVGWHDRISGTLVVPVGYSESDVQHINPRTHYVGTRLIIFLILLVPLIAVGGMFSSIMLSSLGSARESARDSLRVTQIKQLQLAIQAYYAATGEYPTAISTSSLITTGYLQGIIPSDPLTGIPYYYFNCTADSYHIGADLEKSTGLSADHLAAAPHTSRMCNRDPIIGDPTTSCITGEKNGYCFDISEGSTTPDTSSFVLRPEDEQCLIRYAGTIDDIASRLKDKGQIAQGVFYSNEFKICFGLINVRNQDQLVSYFVNAVTGEGIDGEDAQKLVEDINARIPAK